MRLYEFILSENIVRLYHGSDSEFDTFSPGRTGDRLTSLGKGHYLTPDRQMASSYGKYVMEFDVDISGILDWQNMTSDQRQQIEQELMTVVPANRISHFGKTKYEVLPDDKDDAKARYRQLKDLTKDAYNDYAKAHILSDDEILKIDPALLDRIGNKYVVGWKEASSLSNANPQQLMTLMNEYCPDLIRDLGYTGSKFSNQFAIYDHKLAKRVK